MRTIPRVTEQELAAVKLPTHGGRYAVIPHADVISEVKKAVQANGMSVKDTIYRCTSDGQIATGLYFLNSGNDSDIKMMFAWTNSYNKQRRFSCGVGSYVSVCLNGMLSADYGVFSRKHTGSAHEEMVQQINDQFAIADKTFQKMVIDKNKMIERQLSDDQINTIIGKLFMEEHLGPIQMSIVKKQITEPDYTYSGEANSVWHLYNHATHALKMEHPLNFSTAHQKLHELFRNIANDSSVTVEEPVIENLPEEAVTEILTGEEFVVEDVQQNNIEEEETPFWLSL